MSIQQNNFKAIADTIRACLGTVDAISPSSFAEKVSAVSESALSRGYEKGLEEADGVKMACGYFFKGVSNNAPTVFTISGLGFKPKDIRIFTYGHQKGAKQVITYLWKESAGGHCFCMDVNNVSCMNGTLSESDVTTTDDSFSVGYTSVGTSYVFGLHYYWFAFAEEQEGGYV